MNGKLFNIDENYQRIGEKSEIEHAVTYTLKNEYCLETAAFLRICLAGNGGKKDFWLFEFGKCIPLSSILTVYNI